MPALENKVALVTGASRGIGAAIVRRLAADGAAVAFTYAASSAKADELVAAIAAAGGRAVALRADSADPAAIRQAVGDTVGRFGGLDILVNNAGIAVMGPISEFGDADFDRMLAVNVRGTFVATQEAVRHMRDGGRIITIGSVNSDAMPFPGGSVYALTQGAVASFTRGLARDLGPRGITANNIQPGPVDTDMNPAGGPFADLMKSFMALKHFGRGADIAALVSFLAGPEGAFITGASLKIDGGFDA